MLINHKRPLRVEVAFNCGSQGGSKMQFDDSSAHIQADYATDPKYPVKIAAIKLGVSAQTVYREIAAGRLKCYWIGSSIRVGLSHINEYLSRNTPQAVTSMARGA